MPRRLIGGADIVEVAESGSLSEMAIPHEPLPRCLSSVLHRRGAASPKHPSRIAQVTVVDEDLATNRADRGTLTSWPADRVFVRTIAGSRESARLSNRHPRRTGFAAPNFTEEAA